MSRLSPEYHLRRVDSDGAAGPLEILPLDEFPTEANLSRRGFVGAGFTMGSLLSVLNADRADAQEFGVRQRQMLQAHEQAIHALSVGPDGTSLYSASDDHTIKVWSVPEGKLLRTLVGHSAAVNAIAVSPVSDLLASGASDKTIKLWSVANGKVLKTLDGHREAIHSLAIAPDGSTLVSGSDDDSIKIWSLPDGVLQDTLVGHQDRVTSLAIHPNGRGLVSASLDSSVKLWSLTDRRLFRELQRSNGWVDALAVLNDGAELITGSADSQIRLWDLASRKLVHAQRAHPGGVHSLASLAGSRFASAGADHQVRLWMANKSQISQADSLQGHQARVNALAATPNGQWLGSGDANGVIILWNLQRGEMHGFLFDPMSNHLSGVRYRSTDAVTGQVYTYTLPCGAPIPTGATCVCNCVPGTVVVAANQTNQEKETLLKERSEALKKRREDARRLQTRRAKQREEQRQLEIQRRLEMQRAMAEMDRLRRLRPSGGGGGGGTYCSCNKVCICIPVCQAHRLLDSDPITRALAEQLLLIMGQREMAYMQWAADGADLPLRTRIQQVILMIEEGAETDVACWPRFRECLPRLDHTDRVVEIMAAQMLRFRECCFGERLSGPFQIRVSHLINEARRFPWYRRDSRRR